MSDIQLLNADCMEVMKNMPDKALEPGWFNGL